MSSSLFLYVTVLDSKLRYENAASIDFGAIWLHWRCKIKKLILLPYSNSRTEEEKNNGIEQ